MLLTVTVVTGGGYYMEQRESFALEVDDYARDSTWLTQAIEAVASKGYRVMPDSEGGCCEITCRLDGTPAIAGITVYPQAATLTRADKILLGRLTTRDEAGRHFYATFGAGDWLDRMEALGYITIHRPVHGPTGLPYSGEYHTVQVAPEVATWFDEAGDLIDE